MDYKSYYKNSVVNTLIQCIVWSGLSTYIIISKSQIGVNSIPIFECSLFLVSLITSRYITRNKVKFNIAVTIDVLVDFTCLSMVVFLTIIYGISPEASIGIYVLIILVTGVTGIISSEAERDIQDKKLKSEASKRFLKMFRGKHRDFRLYGLTIGGIISLMLLTYANMDLKTYALILLCANIVQTVYDAYLIKKYLFV